MQYSTVHRGNMCLDEYDWRSKSVDRKRLKFATLLMTKPHRATCSAGGQSVSQDSQMQFSEKA